MHTFRNKPVVVEAVQLRWDTWSEVCDLIGAPGGLKEGCPEGCYVDQDGKETSDCNGRIGLKIPTVSGIVLGVENDWIVREESGELHPWSPEYFSEAFEPVDDRESAEFDVDWGRYPKMSAGAATYGDELRALLVEARADAVRFVLDVRADELRKARERERERVLKVIDRQFRAVGLRLRAQDVDESPVGVSVRELSDEDLVQALHNVDCHLDDCDACAEVFFTGSAMAVHTCERGKR